MNATDRPREMKAGPNFTEEVRLLAEALLERVEPTVRKMAASADEPHWESCSWCPVCAATALIRGEQHDFLGVLADHGASVIMVLREALAGAPVEPKLPPERAKAKPSPAANIADEAPAQPPSAPRRDSAATTLINIPVTRTSPRPPQG